MIFLASAYSSALHKLVAEVCAGMCKGVSFIVEGIMFEICDFGKWWNFNSGGR